MHRISNVSCTSCQPVAPSPASRLTRRPRILPRLTPDAHTFSLSRSPRDSQFIAANQEARADNVIVGSKREQMEQVRKDIAAFKAANGLDQVVVLWTANTERYTEVVAGVHDTEANFRAAVERGEEEISPSSLFALACIDAGVPFINGAPQNTFVPGVMEAAIRLRSLIGGDDFKSGQTKMKSVLVDYLVGAGLKPTSIVSYNHLGNNDGYNLSAPQTFRSKEISKSNVVDDMVHSNEILYRKGEHPDHVVVIKYVPYVGDSKRAMDEYTSEIFMGGRNTIVMHNTCEDSLLAAPLILDLVILAEARRDAARLFAPCRVVSRVTAAASARLGETPSPCISKPLPLRPASVFANARPTPPPTLLRAAHHPHRA